jgi:hypothetical protein
MSRQSSDQRRGKGSRPGVAAASGGSTLNLKVGERDFKFPELSRVRLLQKLHLERSRGTGAE